LTAECTTVVGTLRVPHLRHTECADYNHSFRANIALEVLVPPERVSEARGLFTRTGKQLGQRAIYFEVREAGEIIDLD